MSATKMRGCSIFGAMLPAFQREKKKEIFREKKGMTKSDKISRVESMG